MSSFLITVCKWLFCFLRDVIILLKELIQTLFVACYLDEFSHGHEKAWSILVLVGFFAIVQTVMQNLKLQNAVIVTLKSLHTANRFAVAEPLCTTRYYGASPDPITRGHPRVGLTMHAWRETKYMSIIRLQSCIPNL